MELSYFGTLTSRTYFYEYFQINILEEPFEFVTMILYAMSMIIQIFVPCHCASILTHHSELLSRCIFESNWVEQSRPFKSSMLIFAERTKQSIVPMAGGLFEIGLPIFVTVTNCSYIFNKYNIGEKKHFYYISDNENRLLNVCFY